MIDFTLPNDLLAVVSQEDYTHIVRLSISFLEKQWNITQVSNAVIVASQGEGKDIHFGLDNLIRNCLLYDKEAWEGVVIEHFSRFKEHSAAYNYFFKDFDYAQTMLKTLIKPDTFGLPDIQAELIKRQDFPETYTFLVLDFEEQLRFLRKDDLTEWGVSEEELFEIAQDNVNKEIINTQQVPLPEEYFFHTFFHSDFAASYILDFQRNAYHTIGMYGSVVAIPAKSVAFAYTINDLSFMKMIELLIPLVERFYDGQPGNINTHFYWYYQGEFELFPFMLKDEKHMIMRLPERLEMLLRDDFSE
ncbi:MAG: hypothetical protein ACKVTZ_12360 [Bacteroidia bacterium]